MFRPETDWLARWALYTPQRRFLRDHESGRQWSFGEAHAAVEAVVQEPAHRLRPTEIDELERRGTATP